jgi:phosphate transport system substrate-binding protein
MRRRKPSQNPWTSDFRSIVAIASILTIAAAALPAAAAPIEVVIDGTQRLRVADASVAGGMVTLKLLQAPGVPLVAPVERVRCVSGPCPQGLIAQAADRPPAQSFEIQGSNTIGERLMPALVEQYLKKTFHVDAEETPLSDPVEKQVSFDGGNGPVDIVIRAHGTATGFEPLVGVKKPPTAQIWMASRRIHDDERAQARTKQGLDLTAPESEHVIALDGLAIVVNEQNPISALSISEIAQIFAGKITHWQDVKSAQDPTGRPTFVGDIKVYRRDNNSGTTATFNDLVFGPYVKVDPSLKSCYDVRDSDAGACFAPSAAKYESSESLESDVANDKYGVGFIGIGYRQNTKALGIIRSCAPDASGPARTFAYSPSVFNIKTEEYPLARRLYLYTLGEPANALARGVVNFASSQDADAAIRREGFIDQAIGFADYGAQGERFASMAGVAARDDALTQSFIADVRFATRLSTTLRFADKEDTLDNKAKADLVTLANALKSDKYQGRHFLIIGFSDAGDDLQASVDLSKRRASVVAKALQDAGVPVYQDNARAFGSAAPVACNDTEEGRALNRRVEIWVK